MSAIVLDGRSLASKIEEDQGRCSGRRCWVPSWTCRRFRIGFSHRKCFAYTPVPGGVGPLTIATLITHTVDAAEKRHDGNVKTIPIDMAISLLANHHLTLGNAARLAGPSKEDFIETLGTLEIPTVNHSSDDLAFELEFLRSDKEI